MQDRFDALGIHERFGADLKPRANQRPSGTKTQRRRQPPPVCDTSRRENGNRANQIHYRGHEGQRGPGPTVASGLAPLRDDHISAHIDCTTSLIHVHDLDDQCGRGAANGSGKWFGVAKREHHGAWFIRQCVFNRFDRGAPAQEAYAPWLARLPSDVGDFMIYPIDTTSSAAYETEPASVGYRGSENASG
jgi:hypothetical protein